MAKKKKAHHHGRGRVSSHDKTLKKLTLGNIKQHAEKSYDANRGPNALQEAWQQFQIPIAGKAGSIIQWETQELDFTFSFYPATGQRDVPYNTPTCLTGYELLSGEPIMVQACVTAWNKGGALDVNGATVAIGVLDPSTNGLTAFNGLLHVMFQGFGTVRDFDVDDLP